MRDRVFGDKILFGFLVLAFVWTFIVPPLSHGDPAHWFEVKFGELMLVLATAGLWVATAQLVRGADAASEKQLRAWIFVGSSNG